MNRRSTALSLAFLLSLSVGAATASSADAATVKKYPNCAALNKVYKHGVARKGARDKVRGSTKPVTNFTVNTAVYNANTARDGDKDGVACEKH